jgi:hypothetical protein
MVRKANLTLLTYQIERSQSGVFDFIFLIFQKPKQRFGADSRSYGLSKIHEPPYALLRFVSDSSFISTNSNYLP